MASRDIQTIRRQEMPSFFLPLAPATSTVAATKTLADAEVPARPFIRRSSSLSSDASVKSTYKILKLAPVSLGEHADEHKGDWYEVAVE